MYLIESCYSLSCFLRNFIAAKVSSSDEFSASTCSSDDESLESMGEAEGSVNSIVQPYQDEPIANLQGDENTEIEEEDDEDDEDGICFAVLESRFENQETVSNW